MVTSSSSEIGGTLSRARYCDAAKFFDSCAELCACTDTHVDWTSPALKVGHLFDNQRVGRGLDTVDRGTKVGGFFDTR